METNEMKVIVNGREITLQELEELKNNPKKRLKKLTENTYTILEKLEG
jgi:hypothetical protein